MSVPDAALMALRVLCPGCGSEAVVTDGSDPDGAFDAHPDTDCRCCPEDHHHGMAAAACSQEHGDAACGVGADCIVHTPTGEDCPGGHCGPGVDGCTVCRPLIIFAGAALVAHAEGA
jgi:hypothetical protein